MFLILPKTWITFFNWPKFDEDYWNSQMILVQEVTILPSGSVYFAVRGKKEWQNSLSKAFAVDGNTDTASLKWECSCIICPNIQNFCPKNSQFYVVGDATVSPASPCRTLMRAVNRKCLEITFLTGNYLGKQKITFVEKYPKEFDKTSSGGCTHGRPTKRHVSW